MVYVQELLICILIYLNGMEGAAPFRRESKQFGLFNILKFDNVECSERMGVCFTTGECENRNGKINGHCASGFGVCCVFSVTDCGSTVSQNVTYIRNPGFPSALRSTQTCSYTINKASPKICQLRLDFERLATAEPTDGVCGKSVGRELQGLEAFVEKNLNGQHMYVEFGDGNSITWSISVGSDGNVNRFWNIKTSQISCESSFRAPTGCTQYFTEKSGVISSYNRAGERMPAGSSYQNCVRRANGFCSIEYRSRFFTLGSIVTSQTGVCAMGSVSIPNAVGTSISNFCEKKFNALAAQTQNGVIRSDSIPFQLGVTTKNSPLTDFEGFELNYNQSPC
ncbi:unnamed protein product [Lepeophtheirus salmonis]|uniref:(salmon louse) hypothetical protein n=1 Tax=Lepeophtheirus salmonis TaxID=72036 RepID=A0A7R8CIY9_LEPSM|nr:unnamed protein product [Lepeophtheirus salmonis]CAF2833186.1 unnamed protein product [Lepeophtheirus salmonis]